MNLLRIILQLTNIPKDIAIRKVFKAIFGKIGLSINSKRFISNFNIDTMEFSNSFLNSDFKVNSESNKEIINIANNITEHKLLIFNNLIDIKSNSINWQKDYINNYEWNANSESKAIIYGDNSGNDIKVPWEIGRMHELVFIALAYSIDGNKKYLDFYQDYILRFNKNNKLGYGVQWISSMDVSIRLVNLLVSFDLLNQKNIVFSNDFNDIFSSLIKSHAIFINDHTEWSDGMRGNHYLTNLCSFVIFNLYCGIDNFKTINHLTDSLIDELNFQFHKDGGNFESSSYYHALSLEIITWTYYFLSNWQLRFKVSNSSFTEKMSRLEDFIAKSFSFLYPFKRSDGTLIQIGDNDGGHFLNFVNYGFNENKNYLFDLYDSLSLSKSHFIYDNILLKLNKLISSVNLNKFFINSYGSFYRESKWKIFVRSGVKGQNGKGGHDHCDLNSFVLDIEDKEFIIDPGTFCYTSFHNIRNKFRSSEYHNNLTASNREIYRILNETKDDIFWMYGNPEPNIWALSPNSLESTYKGHRISHTRKIEFFENQIIFEDICKGNFEKRVQLHFATEIDLKINDNKLICSKNDISIEIIFPDSNILIEEYEYSRTYGVMEKSLKAIYYTKNDSIEWQILIR